MRTWLYPYRRIDRARFNQICQNRGLDVRIVNGPPPLYNFYWFCQFYRDLLKSTETAVELQKYKLGKPHVIPNGVKNLGRTQECVRNRLADTKLRSAEILRLRLRMTWGLIADFAVRLAETVLLLP